MSDLIPYLPDVALAIGAYLIATTSPGPANLAIMATSMRTGRRAGLFLALGVVFGSLTWGILAALGLSAFMSTFGWLMSALKVAGGLYLFWLAFKAFRSAMRPDISQTVKTGRELSSAQYFGRGLALHLTNPKSIFSWLAVIAIGVEPGAPVWISFLIVGGCWLLGIGVFGGYAIAFSTEPMVRIYTSFRRWIEGTTSIVFGLAGLKLITSRT
ncbi:MAG: LysE family translocator [Sneathiella sp.]|nr:LysE family translocator [Sneathiella sp.]